MSGAVLGVIYKMIKYGAHILWMESGIKQIVMSVNIMNIYHLNKFGCYFGCMVKEALFVEEMI